MKIGDTLGKISSAFDVHPERKVDYEIAEEYFKKGLLPNVKVQGLPIILESRELTHYKSFATLSQEKQVVQARGAGIAVGMIGAGMANSESYGKFARRDSGEMVLTSHRLLFLGGFGALEYNLGEIVSIYNDKKGISVAARNNPNMQKFEVDHPSAWYFFTRKAIDKYKLNATPRNQPIHGRKFCKNCGATLSQSSAFCISCGAKL